MGREYRILVVDDEPAHCDVLATILTAKGYIVSKSNKPREALGMMETVKYDLVLADLMMPELDGIGLLQIVRKKYSNTNVIIMTAYGTIENAVNAMKLGAYTYIIKGSNPEELLAEIRNLEKLKAFKDEKQIEPPSEGLQDYMLETESEAYRETLEISRKAAKSDANILILGESGSGKEVLAQFIHQESKRRNAPFMDVNCFSLTETLIESELFGHEKGSFTGATNTRVGRFEAAEGGTLFLDEIGDIPLVTQSKLLKAIESKKVMRIGRNDPISIDFRLISATNKDLQQEIRTGAFREDLFYRLSTIIIEVPPLRNRQEDLDKLIQYFIRKSESVMAIKIREIDPAVMEFLHHYDYPGNIRELKNMIERLVVLSEDGIIKKSGLMRTKEIGFANSDETFFQGDRPLRDIRSEFESKYISMLLKKNNHNVSKTAEILGISRRQLFNKITEYGLK
ncbi:MAG: sigma-54-dependent Fis family transcriptional regulator [Firmicutes bacterium HGW-Firmicutes-11]|nr:MAG: sigma-54-dependent Fis family transcriptional regulator [Firmicutes bacterium HGW-Firmicutes-11]